MSIPALSSVVVGTARIGLAVGLVFFALPNFFKFASVSVDSTVEPLPNGRVRARIDGEAPVTFATTIDYTKGVISRLHSKGSLSRLLARIAFDVLAGAFLGGSAGWLGHSICLIYPNSRLVPIITAVSLIGN